MSFGDRLGGRLDADADALRNAPARAVGDRQPLGEHVVRHHRGGLLVPVHDVRQREQHVLTGGRGDTELAVRVLADLMPSICAACDSRAERRE